MKVKIDLSKDGLAMIYRPYEIVAWAVVRASPEPVGSGHVWAKTNEGLKQLDQGTISRASVIFFLNREVDKGFMGWNDATGKGGHHRLYFPRYTEKEVLRTIQGQAWDKLARAMGDVAWVKVCSCGAWNPITAESCGICDISLSRNNLEYQGDGR